MARSLRIVGTLGEARTIVPILIVKHSMAVQRKLQNVRSAREKEQTAFRCGDLRPGPSHTAQFLSPILQLLLSQNRLRRKIRKSEYESSRNA